MHALPYKQVMVSNYANLMHSVFCLCHVDKQCLYFTSSPTS